MLERHLCILIDFSYQNKILTALFLPRITPKSASRSKHAIEVTSLKHRWVKFQRTWDMAKCGIFGEKRSPRTWRSSTRRHLACRAISPLFYVPSQSLIEYSFNLWSARGDSPVSTTQPKHTKAPPCIRNIDYTLSLKLLETLYTRPSHKNQILEIHIAQ